MTAWGTGGDESLCAYRQDTTAPPVAGAGESPEGVGVLSGTTETNVTSCSAQWKKEGVWKQVGALSSWAV